MALKFIQQDATTLREAYQERKAEYDLLRTGGRWAGAILYAGTLLVLALKLVMCKHLGVSNLPTIFQSAFEKSFHGSAAWIFARRRVMT